MKKYFNRLLFIFTFKKFLPFLKEYFISNEVGLLKKVTGVFLILFYVFFPFDLIPDYILLFGIIDDIVIATFILERMIKLAPESLKQKYQLLK